MFINRPLIHGTPNTNDMTTRRSKSTKDSKSSIRVKTLPSLPGRKTEKGSKNVSFNLGDDSLMIEHNNLIGIKDVKQMIDMDIQSLIQAVLQFQTLTTEEQTHLIKKHKKLQQKPHSTTISNTTNTNNKSLQHTPSIQQPQTFQQQQQQGAYTQCRQMLQVRNQQSQKLFNKISESIRIKMFQLQQRKLQLNYILTSTQRDIQTYKKQILKRQHEIKLYQKKSTTRQNIRQQLQQQHKNIQQMNQQLFKHKQQSLKQKNEFIQIQAQEIRLMKDIELQQQQQQRHAQLNQQVQYYTKIQKLKQKLLRQKVREQDEIDKFFDQKINEVIRLRIGNGQVQKQAIEYEVKIQQQLAIIGMLGRRSQQLEKEQLQQQGDGLSKMYREKYERLFMNKYNSSNSNNRIQQARQRGNSNHLLRKRLTKMNNSSNNDDHSNNQDSYRELDHWQNYKSYLEKILLNQKRLNNNNSNNNKQRTSFTINSHSHNIDSQSFIITTKANSQVYGNNISDDVDVDVNHQYNSRKNNNNNKNRLRQNELQVIKRRRRQTKIKSTNQPTRMDRELDHGYKKHSTDALLLQLKSESKSKHKHEHNKQYLGERQQQYHVKPRSSLPRLVKMQGNLKDKDKIKHQLTKFTNQQFDSQVELETVRTSEEEGDGEGDRDGEIIEVEFRAKKGDWNEEESRRKYNGGGK